MVICLEQGADLHMAQLMPLPLTVSCFSKIQIGFFSKIQIGFTFLVPAYLGSPRQRAVKWMCECVCSICVSKDIWWCCRGIKLNERYHFPPKLEVVAWLSECGADEWSYSTVAQFSGLSDHLRGRQTTSICNQSSGQLSLVIPAWVGAMSVGEGFSHWITVSSVTRTAGVLIYSRLKALAVNLSQPSGWRY